MQELEKYWESIPIGKENAVTYEALEAQWGMNARGVRAMLAELSALDNGDNYILIRSSRGAGFYLTDDAQDIAAYRRECRGRALKIFAPLKKINRVLNAAAADCLNYSFTNNIKLMRIERELTQGQVCKRLHELGSALDISMLSKIENNYALPTPADLSALALIFNCEPFELVGMQEYTEREKNAESGLQVAQTRRNCDATRQL